MKKLVTVLLTVCMLAMVACQGATPDPAPAPAVTSAPATPAATAAAAPATAAPQQTAAATAPPQSQPPLKISWVPQNDAPVNPDSPGVLEFEKRMNIDIDFVYFERAQLADLLQLRVATGDIPDVMWLVGNRNLATNLSKQGVLAEIKPEYVKEKMPATWAGTNELCGEDIWELNQIDGKNYGIPTPFSENIYPFVPIIRDDWLKKVGINDLPVTLEDHEKAFYAFANDDPDGNGKKDTYALSITGMKPVFGAFGGLPMEASWQRQGDKVVYTPTMPEMFEALTYLAKWYKDGLIDPEFVTGENKGQAWANTVTFWNGVIGYSSPGMYYHIRGILNPNNPKDLGSNTYQQFKAIQGPNATYKEIKPMVGPKGASGSILWGTAGSVPDLTLGVHLEKDKAKYDRIMEIAELQNKDWDLYLLCTRGVEGVEYEKTNDPKEPFRTLLDTSDNLINAKHGLGLTGMMMSRNNIKFINDAANQYEVEYKRQFLDWPGYTSFVRLTLPSAAMYESQINTARNEAYWNFVMGQRPCTQAEWTKFIGELNALGLETLEKEANEYLQMYYK